MKRLLALLLVIGCATSLSCSVNDFCLNCETGGGDGGPGDGGGDATDADNGDAGDAGPCVPTGNEVCDDKDNDCDGNTDEGPLPEVGDACANQVGECAGGVKQCVSGAMTCSKNPSPEQCDLKDNDCNGLTDEGDPGGGAKCGTDQGECVAGTLRCNLTTGTIQCIGAIGGTSPPFGTAEGCNGRDDDCDGNFDEGIGSLGSCGGGPGADPSEGECQAGTLQCVGGGTVCVNDVGPAFEACDNKDNDCDARTDEETDKNTDPQNCGGCGNICNLPNAFEGCAGGNCTIAACANGFHNNNGQTADGCEFGPCTIQGNEVCNGQDDNCNGQTDEALTPPPGLCLTQGACAGATATCQGVDGFRCNYNGDVTQDANGNVLQETKCDGIDNDCDGRVDEGQPNLGQACNDGGVGACRGTGTFQCDAANLDGPAVCVITQPGSTATAEICDGKDNDCNGVVDNGANTGNLPGQDWITIPGSTVQIQKWEASRTDSSATAQGTNTQFVCSKQGVQPWTNITAPQAAAACTAIGARLCTEAEWQSMCSQLPTVTYPVAAPTTATDHVFIEAEQAFANATVGGRTWSSLGIQNFSGTTSLESGPDGDNLNLGQAANQSARLDFQFTIAANTNYFLWVRVFGNGNNDNAIHVGLNATQPGAATQTLAPPVNGQWTWVVNPVAFTSATAGTRFFSVYMAEGGTFVDAITVSRDGINPPPVDEKSWAVQDNVKFPQAQVCNGDEFDTSAAAGDQDDILATGSRPACFANGPGTTDAFDMSGNVKEWTAPRSAGQNPLRGGASNNEVNGLTCQLNFTLADNDFFFPNVGFRCCR